MSPSRWLLMTLLCGVPTTAAAQDPPPDQPDASNRPERPHAFGVELGGRGRFYSVQYDHSVTDRLALGLGAMVFPPICFMDESCPGRYKNDAAFPVYASFYLQPTNQSVFVTGGATVLRDHFGRWGTVPVMGVGLEERNRTNRGAFRLTLYGAFGHTDWARGYGPQAGDRVRIWAGVYFGRR
jgi:hypothetical protein